MVVNCYIYCTGLQLVTHLQHLDPHRTKCVVTIMLVLANILLLRNVVGDTFNWMYYNNYECSEYWKKMALVLEIEKILVYPMLSQLILITVIWCFASI